MAIYSNTSQLLAQYIDRMETVSLTSDEVKDLPDNISEYRRRWFRDVVMDDSPYVGFDPDADQEAPDCFVLFESGADARYQLVHGLYRINNAIRSEMTDGLTFRVFRDASDTDKRWVAALLHIGSHKNTNTELRGWHFADAFTSIKKNIGEADLEWMARTVGYNKDHMRKCVKSIQAGLYPDVIRKRLSTEAANFLIQDNSQKLLADYKEGKIYARDVNRQMKVRRG